MCLMKKKKKIYHLISKNKYFIILLQIYHLKGPPKDIYFNDFIDAETLFDDIESRFEDVEKNQREYESKLSSVRIGGDK